MKREHFVKVVEETLDSLPQEFRSRIRKLAVLVEDVPPNQPSRQSGQQRRLSLKDQQPTCRRNGKMPAWPASAKYQQFTITI